MNDSALRQKPLPKAPQPPEIPMYADTLEFKKGRHTPSEIKTRRWLFEYAA
jgi:hypothetical protein